MMALAAIMNAPSCRAVARGPQPTHRPAPARRRQPTVRIKEDREHEHGDRRRPRRLDQHRERPQWQVATVTAVVQHRIDRADRVEQQKTGDTQHQPAHRLTGPRDADNQADDRESDDQQSLPVDIDTTVGAHPDCDSADQEHGLDRPDHERRAPRGQPECKRPTPARGRSFVCSSQRRPPERLASPVSDPDRRVRRFDGLVDHLQQLALDRVEVDRVP